MPAVASAEPSFRRQVFDLLDGARRFDFGPRIANAAMVALIAANVAAAVAETVPDIATQHAGLLSFIKWLALIVFAVEYALRLWSAPEHPMFRYAGDAVPPLGNRLRCAATPAMVIDLIALLSFLPAILFPSSASAPLARIASFLKLARYSPALTTIGHVLAAQKSALAACVVLFGGLLLASAALIYWVEGNTPGSMVADMPSALWWSLVTLTKFGVSDAVPTSAAGKFVAALVMLLGIGFLALPVGIIGRGFYDEIRRRDFVISFAMVARVPLFSGLDAAALCDLVGLLKARKVQPRTVIIRKGEPGDAMYLIASGQVEVLLDAKNGSDPQRIKLSDGDFFGEMALLSHAPRTATVTALRTTELLVLEAQDFDRLLAANPKLSERLQQTAQTRTA
jgi:voltage-gated potassium channel